LKQEIKADEEENGPDFCRTERYGRHTGSWRKGYFHTATLPAYFFQLHAFL